MKVALVHFDDGEARLRAELVRVLHARGDDVTRVCGAGSEPECPPEAIKADTESGLEKWLSVNAEYAKNWPNISQKGTPPADAKDMQGVPDKFEKFFDPNPGTGS